MKENKKFPKLIKHLKIFIRISILIFLGMFAFSILFITFGKSVVLFTLQLPVFVHYLDIFISIMMLIMGVTYLKFLNSEK